MLMFDAMRYRVLITKQLPIWRAVGSKKQPSVVIIALTSLIPMSNSGHQRAYVWMSNEEMLITTKNK